MYKLINWVLVTYTVLRKPEMYRFHSVPVDQPKLMYFRILEFTHDG